jgi:hypothetical protein
MARLTPEFIPPQQLSEDDIIAIVAIGRQQALLMDQLQAALEASNELEALRVARIMVGLEKKVRER